MTEVIEKKIIEDWIDFHGFETHLEKWKNNYNKGHPFPHIVIDNFLPTDIANQVEQSFPHIDLPVWKDHGIHYTIKGGIASKYELGHKPSFPISIANLYDKFLFNLKFVNFVENITNISNLHFDADFVGNSRSGGLNAVKKGGMLIRHADFNYSNDLKLYRAVNVLLYLNKNWKLEDGGNLDLWDKEMKGPPTSIIPIFNRCLIFATNSQSYHGYNEVLTENIRKSLNLYYFTKLPAVLVSSEPKKTDWKPLNQSELDVVEK